MVNRIILEYNQSYHRTIKMTPLQALGRSADACLSIDEQQMLTKEVHERVIANTAAAGQYNLERVRAERVKHLPPLALGERVMVAATSKRKRHGTERGYASSCSGSLHFTGARCPHACWLELTGDTIMRAAYPYMHGYQLAGTLWPQLTRSRPRVTT